MKRSLGRRDWALALAAVAGLGGCEVGPDYRAPELPQAAGYLPNEAPCADNPAQPPSVRNADLEQRIELGGTLPRDWWLLFHCPQLDRLVSDALSNHPSLAEQRAAIEQARQQVAAANGAFFPSLGVGGNAERGTLNQFGVTYAGFGSAIGDFYSTSINVSYVLDIFGGQRRDVEGLNARFDSQRYALEASALTIAVSVAEATTRLATLRAQIGATDEIVAAEQKQLQTIERRYALGSLTETDVLQQRTEITATTATEPGLRQQLAAAEHQLAALTDRLPSSFVAPDLTLADFELPRNIPVALPSELARQRPDIRQAEALLHAANAQIGVTEAAMLPSLSIGANYGTNTTQLDQVFSSIASGWNLLGGVTAPLFKGGALTAQNRAAIAARDEAAAHYRTVVLNAFQNVADALSRSGEDKRALELAQEQTRLAKASLDLASRRYAIGALDYASLLATQQTYLHARLEMVAAMANRLQDTVMLFQAVGSGWWDDATLDARISAIND